MTHFRTFLIRKPIERKKHNSYNKYISKKFGSDPERFLIEYLIGPFCQL